MKKQTNKYTHTHHKGSLCADERKKQTDKYTHTPQSSLCVDERKKKTDKYTHTTKAHFVQMRGRRGQTSTHTPQRLTLHRRDKWDGCAASQWHCTTQPHPAAG